MNRTAIKESVARGYAQFRLYYPPAAHRTNQWRPTMKQKSRTLLCLALAAGLAGCASSTPMLDETFGDAVRAARLAQTLNPDAGRNAEPVLGLDGPAAQAGMVLYRESFKSPPPVTNVINIGGAMGGSSSASQ